MNEKNQSDSISEITKSLIEVQKKLQGAKKDANNPFFNSQYSTLNSVIDATRELLTVNGIAVIQSPVISNDVKGGILLETKLVHVSGEWFSSILYIPAEKQNAHGYGSAMTYARRFALSAMVGVVQEDDDGNNSVNMNKKTQTTKTSGLSSQEMFEELTKNLSADVRELARPKIAGVQAFYSLAESLAWDAEKIKTELAKMPNKVTK